MSPAPSWGQGRSWGGGAGRGCARRDITETAQPFNSLLVSRVRRPGLAGASRGGLGLVGGFHLLAEPDHFHWPLRRVIVNLPRIGRKVEKLGAGRMNQLRRPVSDAAKLGS